MIAPIRETPTNDKKDSAQRRKARRWIVESLLSRAKPSPRPRPVAEWKQWLCAAWIVLVAGGYFFKMLGSLFGLG